MLLRETFMSVESTSVDVNAFVPARTTPPLRARIIRTLAVWQTRARERRELAAMCYLDLKDIGYPAGAAAEKLKPFWKA
jgi:uncharacterized protein YjiS (DUF1127 family)